MAVREDCAWIKVDSTSEYVDSLIVVDEADYEWLRDIWPSFSPGEYLIWPELLPLSAGEVGPISLGWRKAVDGTWYKPLPPEPTPPTDPTAPTDPA